MALLWTIVLLAALLCALFMFIPDWDKRICQPFKPGAPKAPLDRYKILKKSKGR